MSKNLCETASIQEFVRHHLARPFNFIEIEEISSSYLAPFLLEACKWFGFSDIYEWGIDQLKDIHMSEFYPADEKQIYLEKMKKGTRRQVKPPVKWTQFLEWYSTKQEHLHLFPNETDNEEMLLLISFCYGNRIFHKMNVMDAW